MADQLRVKALFATTGRAGRFGIFSGSSSS